MFGNELDESPEVVLGICAIVILGGSGWLWADLFLHNRSENGK